jgi:hypothetical protein
MILENNYYWFKSALSTELCNKIIDAGMEKMDALQKEFGEKSLINLGYLKKSTCDEFVKYFGIRLNELGENFKRRILKTASQYEEI